MNATTDIEALLHMTDEQQIEHLQAQLTRLERALERAGSAVDACQRWEAAHDGKINAYWEQQFRTNKRVDEALLLSAARLTAVEKKIMWAAGFAAAAGASVGSVLSTFLG